MTEPTNAADRRRGPRGGSSDTRAGIRLAARAEFAERGYAGATIRSIAARAEVDPALIHHYFGTKRELYLEVVRRLAIVPPHVPEDAVRGIPEAALELRIEASIDYWLAVASRHQFVWTSTIISAEAPIRDPEIAQILDHAEAVAADRMLEALGLSRHRQRERLHIMLLSFGALAVRTLRQWLIQKSLTRDEVGTLLCLTLRTIICDVVPSLDD